MIRVTGVASGLLSAIALGLSCNAPSAAAEPPGWRVHVGTLTAGWRIESACITSDGRYVMLTDDTGQAAAFDLREPNRKPVRKRGLGFVALAPAGGSDVFAGRSDGRLARVRAPTFQETALDLKVTDLVADGLTPLTHGFVLASGTDRACVLRAREGKLESVLEVAGAFADSRVAAAGFGVALLERPAKGRRGTREGPWVQLRVELGAVRTDLDVSPWAEETRAIWPGRGLVPAAHDGRSWVVRRPHAEGEYRLRTDAAGKGDVPLPIRGRVAVAAGRTDHMFAVDDKGGLVLYDAGRRERLVLVEGQLAAPVTTTTVSPDASAVVVGTDDGDLIIAVRDKPAK